MVLATWWGWGDAASIALAVALAFFFGYLLTFINVRRAGLDVRAAVRIALAADTVSILVDGGRRQRVPARLCPGAMEAGLASGLFWWSLALALAVAFVLTVPVNRWMIGRGRGHAVVHDDAHGTTEAPYDRAISASRSSWPSRSCSLVSACALRARGRRRATGDPDPDRAPTSAPRQTAAWLLKRRTGTLTIGTDSPAFAAVVRRRTTRPTARATSPRSRTPSPRSSASPATGQWVKVPFNNSYKPGAKDFDFDINQISITPERAEVVDFSDGYYSAAQAVIALKGSAGAEAHQRRRPQGPAARRPDRHDVADRDPRRHPARRGPAGLQRHQRRQAGAAQRPGRRDPRRPADRVLHHRRGDPEGHDRRAVPARRPASRRSSACCSRRAASWSRASTRRWRTLEDDGTLEPDRAAWLSDVVDVPVLTSERMPDEPTGSSEPAARSSAPAASPRLQRRSATVATGARCVVLGLLVGWWSAARRGGRGCRRRSSAGSTRRRRSPRSSRASGSTCSCS